MQRNVTSRLVMLDFRIQWHYQYPTHMPAGRCRRPYPLKAYREELLRFNSCNSCIKFSRTTRGVSF
jgi:hypothetical protein